MLRRHATVLLVSTAALTLGACQPKSEGNAVPVNATAQAPSPNEANTAEHNAAQAAIPAGCKIMDALDWAATINAQPPTAPRLGVSGTVVVNTTGYKAELARKGIDLNPKIVTLELTITPPAPGTIVNQVVSRLKVEAKVPDVVRDLEKVVINCGGTKMAEITDIKVLD